MLRQLSERFGVSTGVVALVLALILVQLGLQVYSLIDLAKRSRVPGGRKWLWAVVIIAGNLLGVIIYLALGRSAPLAGATASGVTAEARAEALDRLYRDRR